jgi:hypothetical protein
MDRRRSNELNKRGIDYYDKATSNLVFTGSENKDLLSDSCLYFMAEAIRVDSSNRSAYWNKLAFERGLNRLEAAKATAWLYYKTFDDPFGLLSLGSIHRELGDTIKSKEFFIRALDFYDEAIKSGKVTEDSILLDLCIVNLANGNMAESRKYYEKYRTTPKGQLTFKEIDFDSAHLLLDSSEQ